MPNAGMVVLPQFQGNYYDLQRQQALAQALTQQALQGSQPAPAAAVGPYQVQPKYSMGAGIAQLGQALLASRMADKVSQGYGQLGAQQAQAFGFGAPAAQASDSSNAALAQGASQGDVGPTLTNAARMGSQQAPAQASGGLSVSPMNPLGLPPALAYTAYASDPAKYAEMQAAAYKPADIVSQIRAAGIDPNSALGRQLAQNALAKATAPDYVSGRPGGYMLNKSTGQMEQLPQVPEGFTAVQGSNGWQIVPVQGGLGAIGESSSAKEAGKAQYELKEVWDPTANNGQGGYVQQTVANVAGAAGAPNANAPLPLRNNNPGAVSPRGAVAKYPDMQTGLAEMDQNLANYAKDPNVRTLGDAITKWVGSPPNAPAYVKDVSTRLGIPANTPIDLTNPAQRQAIGTAIMLHENGPSAVFAGGRAAQSGPMASQPPLGATPAANAAQSGAPESMKKDYEGMLQQGPQNQQALDALDKMLGLAQRKSVLAGGPIGSTAPLTWVSPDAAEYDKQRANLIALQSKSLGQNGSDKARENISESIPDYGKPKTAMLDGLQTQRNQIAANQLRRNLLTPAYNAGDSKTYTALANGFDQNIKPSMVPVLMMEGPQQRAAVQAAVKSNPALRSSFEWAFNNGLLK